MFFNKLILIAVFAMGVSAFAKDAKTSDKKSGGGLLSKALAFVQEECIVRNNMALNEMNDLQKAADQAFNDMIGGPIVATQWLGNTGLSVTVVADDKDNTIHIIIHGVLPPENFQPPLESLDKGMIRDAILKQLNETVRPAMQTDAGFSFQVKLCKDEDGAYLDPVASNGGRIRLFKGENGTLVMQWKIPKSVYPDVLKRNGTGS